ncbi:MAG: hypothetical protein IPP78_00425 [Holophagaceae bacterium]|nr:hypothetical protein [Holophagaceae bacterium]
MRSNVSPLRLKVAWVVAVGTDALQVFIFPATVEGVFSPVTVILDFIAMALLSALVGWHWAFLPSIVVELIPGLELAPTWTIALAIASRGLNKQTPAAAFPTAETPKDVTPYDEAHTITVEAKSSPSAEDPGKKI